MLKKAAKIAASFCLLSFEPRDTSSSNPLPENTVFSSLTGLPLSAPIPHNQLWLVPIYVKSFPQIRTRSLPSKPIASADLLSVCLFTLAPSLLFNREINEAGSIPPIIGRMQYIQPKGISIPICLKFLYRSFASFTLK